MQLSLPIIYENTRERANFFLWIYFLAGKESEVDLNSKACEGVVVMTKRCQFQPPAENFLDASDTQVKSKSPNNQL